MYFLDNNLLQERYFHNIFLVKKSGRAVPGDLLEELGAMCTCIINYFMNSADLKPKPTLGKVLPTVFEIRKTNTPPWGMEGRGFPWDCLNVP